MKRAIATPTVVILYRHAPAYRAGFYRDLRVSLAEVGVRLDLIIGEATHDEARKRDSVELDWAVRVRNRSIVLFGKEIIYQPVFGLIRHADLVIVEQANKLLVNYLLLLAGALRFGPPVAFWGHGANLQSRHPDGPFEKLKRVYSRWAYWWFAYTVGVQSRLQQLGFPSERITVVQNSIDTEALKRDLARVGEGDLAAYRERHGLVDGRTAVFIGGLYADKRLDFLLAVAQRASAIDSRFVLLIGGDGVLADRVRTVASVRHEVQYLGRVDGPERAFALRAAELMLMPGLVGLAVIDAFMAGTPLVTTAYRFHSPEIEYLVDGDNGLMLPEDASPECYADAVLAMMDHPDRIERLREGCARAASVYTHEAMVSRFADGVVTALERLGRLPRFTRD